MRYKRGQQVLGASSVVCLRITKKSVRVLTVPITDEEVRRRKNATHVLPGGHIEEGERPLEAARRELREETERGIHAGSLFPFSEFFKRSWEDYEEGVWFYHHFFLCLYEDTYRARVLRRQRSRTTGPPLLLAHDEVFGSGSGGHQFPESHSRAAALALTALWEGVYESREHVRHPVFRGLGRIFAADKLALERLGEAAHAARRYLSAADAGED